MISLLKALCSKVTAAATMQERLLIISNPEYSSIRSLLCLIYDPHRPFHLSSDGLRRWKSIKRGGHGISPKKYYDLEMLLRDLSQRRITGNEAYAAVAGFIERQPAQYRPMLMNVMDKNLGLRLSARAIDQALRENGFIFDSKNNNSQSLVSLARHYSKDLPVDFNGDEWFVSRKFDGVRCLLKIDSSNVVALSRQNRLLDVPEVIRAIQTHLLPKLHSSVGGDGVVVIDGELCALDSEPSCSFAKENFPQTVASVLSKSVATRAPLTFLAFDILRGCEWNAGKSQRTLKERLDMLSSIFRDGVGIVGSSITSVNSFAFPSGFKRMPYSASIGLVEQLKCQSKEHLEELFLDSRGKSWEGLIIRRNTGYKAGRTGNYLKMKQDFDAEYTIVGCRTGPMRLFVNGKEQLLPVVLKSVDIIHKGQSVSVGSGFTAAERIRYGMNGGKDIIGRKITVKFAGETSPVSHCGRSSLRFPVVKILWDADGRDI